MITENTIVYVDQILDSIALSEAHSYLTIAEKTGQTTVPLELVLQLWRTAFYWQEDARETVERMLRFAEKSE